MEKDRRTVAIFNTSEDIVEIFRVLLEKEGFNSVMAHVPDIERGDVDLLSFLATHDPVAIIYDVPPPYEQSWNILKQIRNMEAMKGRKFVITTTNKAKLEKIIGEVGAFEIAQKPYDFEAVVHAVNQALAD